MQNGAEMCIYLLLPRAHCHRGALGCQPAGHWTDGSNAGSQAAERSLTELKEFASQLKALPNIQRHIGLAEAVNRVINAPAFRARVGSEQSILDGQSADAAAEAIEVGQSLLIWIRYFNSLYSKLSIFSVLSWHQRTLCAVSWWLAAAGGHMSQDDCASRLWGSGARGWLRCRR